MTLKQKARFCETHYDDTEDICHRLGPDGNCPCEEAEVLLAAKPGFGTRVADAISAFFYWALGINDPEAYSEMIRSR